MTLGCPAESEAQLNPAAVSDWAAEWRSWRGPGEVVWCERRWRTLGVQKLPERLVLQNARCVAQWIGEETRWDSAGRHYAELTTQWPDLAARLPRYYDALADYDDREIQRLATILSWLKANPRSNLYPRQLPVAGMDTKWFEPRLPMIADLVGGPQGGEALPLALRERCGLKEAPLTVRFRILDPALRQKAGGMEDVSTRIGDLCALRLPATKVFIVENLQTGLAFDDCPNAVVFMGLGYGVGVLARVPWICEAECIYWGDLDTHGFAILNRARACLPRLQSTLMDEATLFRYKHLWSEEKDQYSGPAPHLLTHSEEFVYTGLKQQRWGRNLRMEQERIAWNEAWGVLNQAGGRHSERHD